ncbi:MAG: FG-GAP-like repeat-containing protein [Candidatus Cloacimonetes bacterium]|nr:FG-GAP-like repeat-containing protein [Candidatus Cloacimonadota bacterium]
MKMKRLLLVSVLLTACILHAVNNMPLLAQMQGEHNNSGYGYSLVSLDFNHDGYDDLVVLATFYGYQYQQTPSRGKVYIYYGGPSFGTATQPAMTLEGDYSEGLGRLITRIYDLGDVNGDGFDDLMITDVNPNLTSSARSKYFFGGTSDLSTPAMVITPLQEETLGSFFELGDVDGDGYEDLGINYILLNEKRFDIQWGGTFERQLIFSGIEVMPNVRSIAGIGDINGDGYNDFTIGYVSSETEPYNSIINLYYGNPDRVFANPIVLIQTTESITRLCKPLGDINGDGYNDFFAYANPYGMRVWFGTTNLSTVSPDIVLNPVYFGNDSVRGIESGDVNGDGFSDVVGASYSNQRFAVWLGSSTMNGQADWIKFNQYENFGYDLAMGDYNGDGFCDIAVSAPMEEGSWPLHDYRGYVFIYAGYSGMVANNDPLAPQLSQQLQMMISPNPVRNTAEISIDLISTAVDKGKPVRIEVFNLKGQSVYQSEDNSTPFAEFNRKVYLSNYPSGIYLCRAQVGNKQISKKFTIIK